MINSLFNTIKKHVKENLFIYFLVILCFLIGVSVGAFTVKVINEHQKQELVSYLRGFFQLFDDYELKASDILRQSITNNLQLMAINWILGIIVIGIPFIFGIIGFKGFVIGFTVGLLIDEFKFWGILLFLFAVFPQNLIFVPVFIGSTVISLTFSVMLVKVKVNKVRNFSFLKQFLLYSAVYFILCIVVVIGSLIESFITPIFIRLIVSYMG